MTAQQLFRYIHELYEDSSINNDYQVTFMLKMSTYLQLETYIVNMLLQKNWDIILYSGHHYNHMGFIQKM